MAKIIIPIKSSDLIAQLEQRFPDELDVRENTPSFDRGKRAGIFELLRELKHYLKGETEKKTVTI